MSSAAGGSPFTLRELLTREAAAAHGCLARVREGVYCLRAGVDAPMESTDAAGAVLAALRSLAAEGLTVVTRRNVETAIAATGISYSSRAVRAGLLALLQAEMPAVVRVPRYRYALSRDTAAPIVGGGAAQGASRP